MELSIKNKINILRCMSIIYHNVSYEIVNVEFYDYFCIPNGISDKYIMIEQIIDFEHKNMKSQITASDMLTMNTMYKTLIKNENVKNYIKTQR